MLNSIECIISSIISNILKNSTIYIDSEENFTVIDNETKNDITKYFKMSLEDLNNIFANKINIIDYINILGGYDDYELHVVFNNVINETKGE